MELQILYQDARLIAVNKPPGLLTHRSPIAADAFEFAVQILRNQVGQQVFPVHRLDRKTSGVLLFAFNKIALTGMHTLFAERKVEKEYLAIARGYTEEEGKIDYPLKKENGTIQEAVTFYSTLSKTELPIPFGKHETIRYSLVKVKTETGRMHQIRKHFAHINHPLIADRPHGCNKQNKLFKEKWNMDTLMLHASSLSFVHPVNMEKIVIKADLQSEFKRMLEELKLEFKV